MDPILVLVGAAIIALVAFARFDAVPPSYNDWCRRGPSSLMKGIGDWYALFTNRNIDAIEHKLFPPPCANTTHFKYFIHRFGYTLIWVGIYIGIIKIPGLSDQVQTIIDKIINPNQPGAINKTAALLLGAGPITSAFVIGVLVPLVPPFKTADLYIRSFLYHHASIPAQLFREVWRLQHADFVVKDSLLEKVREDLVSGGFDAEDIHYEPDKETSSSLWTKIALLMDVCMKNATDDRYNSAFSILEDCVEKVPSYTKLKAEYNAMKGDAKICFMNIRSANDDTVIARDEAFRQNCNDLLDHIYTFLARVSLHSFYSEEERIKGMREMGFNLAEHKQAPLPDTNELIMLILILTAVLIIPLSLYLGISKAIMIGSVIYSAILMPIYLAYQFPKLRREEHRDKGRNIPDFRLPITSAISAVLFGIFLILLYRLIENRFDFGLAWNMYASRYPWSFIHGSVSFMIAWRMQVGSYPEIDNLQGLKTVKVWGDLKDAAIILLVNLTVFLTIVYPKLVALNAAPSNMMRTIAILSTMLFCIGFIIPTWYRAKIVPKHHERRGSEVKRERYSKEYQKYRDQVLKRGMKPVH